MKLFLQLSSVEDADGVGSAYVDVKLERSDLDRPFSEFAAIFLEPALEQLKLIHEGMKVNER